MIRKIIPVIIAGNHGNIDWEDNNSPRATDQPIEAPGDLEQILYTDLGLSLLWDRVYLTGRQALAPLSFLLKHDN